MLEVMAFFIGFFCGGLAVFFIYRKKQDELGELKLNVVRSEEQLIAERLKSETLLKTQQDFFKKEREQTIYQFESIAQKILDQKTQLFDEKTQLGLTQTLLPFREQLTLFEKFVSDKFLTETQERFMLKGEIERLIQTHNKMANETESLTKALKGDNKFQGDWGEIVLERILETSGLRPGQEYEVQASGVNEKGETLRPDVLIRLPEDKHIIIDSKVSLKSFEYLQNIEYEEKYNQLLAEHIKSVENHVTQLASKKYQEMKGLNSPDFVFLFIPIEPAWLIVLKSKPELGSWAWEKGIAIVTASTLFTSLRTVSNLWRIDRQNKNALKIATEAGSLYDKFYGFIEELEKLGQHIESTQKSFQVTRNRLIEGRGNIVGKIQKLRELGAKTSKKIKLNTFENLELNEDRDSQEEEDDTSVQEFVMQKDKT